MLIAVLSDIHGNREAYEACLAQARALGADRHVILGDIVGYGADPDWCVEKTRQLQAEGAIVIRGNHDQALGEISPSMNDMALAAIRWTRYQLKDRDIDWLITLPMSHEDEDGLYVHADASRPERFIYVTDADRARAHLDVSRKRVSFVGHVHRPALYGMANGGDRIAAFTPNSDNPLPLPSQRRWLAVMGAVGQPRDKNPMAAWGLYDTAKREVRFMRTTYDIRSAQMKIRAAGLPDFLAERLSTGV